MSIQQGTIGIFNREMHVQKVFKMTEISASVASNDIIAENGRVLEAHLLSFRI